MSIRVVQWTTGNVGKQSVDAVLRNPDLELVGCYAWSPDKFGTDVGELCGLDPIGIAATNDVDALLALRARLCDLQPDVDGGRRDGAHPRVRCQPREHRRVHHRPRSGGRSPAARRGVRARRFVGLRDGHQPRLGPAARDGAGVGVRPDRQDHGPGVGRLHALRLARDRAARRVRPPHRRPRAAGDDRARHRGVRRGGAHARRRPRRRARRCGVRGRVRADHRGPRPRLLEDPGGLRRRDRCELAGAGGRPHRGGAERPVAQGPDPRPRLEARHRLPDPDRRAADHPHQGRPAPAGRLPGHDVRRVHGARDDHDVAARDQRDPAVVAAPPGIVTYTDLYGTLPRGWVPAG